MYQENGLLNKEQSTKIAEYVISCRIPDLARMNGTRLLELFKLDCQDSPGIWVEDSSVSLDEFILREKIYRSLYLIENLDETSAKELAMILGFADTEEFVRLFKKNLFVEPDRYIFLVKNKHLIKCV